MYHELYLHEAIYVSCILYIIRYVLDMIGHVVEGVRLRFRLRGQIRCLMNMFEAWGREAMVLPPSVVDSSASISDIDTDPDIDIDTD